MPKIFNLKVSCQKVSSLKSQDEDDKIQMRIQERFSINAQELLGALR